MADMMMFLVAEHQHRSKQSLHLSTAPDYPHQYSESVLVLRDPDDVHLGQLCLQGDAAGLRVEADHLRACVV